MNVTPSSTKSTLGEIDAHLFNEGTHARLYDKLGAQVGDSGTHFAVWAPNASEVCVIADFNGWMKGSTPLAPFGSSGIWAGNVPRTGSGVIYKYAVRPRSGGDWLEKADPFAFVAEVPPRTGSVTYRHTYAWGDAEWMATRHERNRHSAPQSIYEIHLGSWRRGDGRSMLSYRDLADPLVKHMTALAFTHVEMMPITEHPYYPSWGYQTTGYFAPSSRYGSPDDLKYLIDRLHQAGIGVILDWVPSHFPSDAHGLARFDGTALYEHLDPKEGFHPDWNTYVFNLGRNEVRSFLLSSAFYWLERFHFDGLRLDAVASMLYRDYSRPEGQWIPNRYGGRENLESIDFLRELNRRIGAELPDTQTYAEESTAWPGVSRPVDTGGLGFHYKWDMGWMHDTLSYLSRDPVHRKYHHNEITFRGLYAFSENYILPLSHDEVVHGKGSLLKRMPGDEWQQLANLRALFGYMYAQPGKKLLFMGSELGSYEEWDHANSLPWHLLDDSRRGGLQRWIGDLNRLYRAEPAMHEVECEPRGFMWIDGSDNAHSVLAFCRQAAKPDVGRIAVVCNFTPAPQIDYRIGVPQRGYWSELLNSDAEIYGGSGMGNLGGLRAVQEPMHGHWFSLSLTLPPLSVVFLKSSRRGPEPVSARDQRE